MAQRLLRECSPLGTRLLGGRSGGAAAELHWQRCGGGRRLLRGALLPPAHLQADAAAFMTSGGPSGCRNALLTVVSFVAVPRPHGSIVTTAPKNCGSSRRHQIKALRHTSTHPKRRAKRRWEQKDVECLAHGQRRDLLDALRQSAPRRG